MNKAMNLGKLLAAGKSIIGGRREISYRVSNRGYLPKFVSPKNPFAPAAPPDPAPKAEETPGKKDMAWDRTKTQKLPACLQAGRGRGIRLGKWNPLALWHSFFPIAPQKLQRPLQAELSLDRVKVVHNDLTDADVEIVPIKSRTAPEAEASLVPAAQAGDSWSRLSARIFGAKAA